MPPKAKHKNANQHEKRHDAGLAPPGKRVSKDKTSLPTTNGHASGKAVSSSPPPALPSTGLNQGLHFPRPPPLLAETGQRQSSDEKVKIAGVEGKDIGLTDVLDEDESMTGVEVPSVERTGSDSGHFTDMSSIKGLSAQPGTPLSVVATILKSCPLYDAVAILILLLSLPPTLIITVHSLFASLTFIPPAAGFAWSTWMTVPTFGDLFHSTSNGGPSPALILVADAIMTFVYSSSPTMMQNILLDLAQSVIAISLSGASPGKGRSSNSVTLCTMVILFSHFVRVKSVHVFGLSYLRSALHSTGLMLTSDHDRILEHVSAPATSHGWARMLLGCHILAQGIVTLLRRSLAGTSQPSMNKKQDPELANSFENTRGLVSTSESNPESTSASSTDGRPPGPSPAVRDNRERVSTSKKKRKQANEVRSRQPLWAAIASTKVTVFKEMEQKQASADVLESAEAESQIIGHANIFPHDDRIWIVDIRSHEIVVKVHLSAANGKSSESTSPDIEEEESGKPKPFHVRMNGADWGSVRDLGAADERGAEDQFKSSWVCEIYGLTPMTSYGCEFIRLSDKQVICTSNLITLPAPSQEQATTTSAPTPHQSLRPLSPTSTLKQSIAAAEVKREDIRNKLKRSRKEHKNAATSIRREIEQLNGKVLNSGGQDEKQRQRILQYKQNIKQAEDAAAALKEELEGMGDIPEDELQDAAAKKEAYEAAYNAKAAADSEMSKIRSEALSEVSQVQAELNSTAQKRERLNTRRSKLDEQHERLVSEQNANLNARQRYEQERARIQEERGKHEAQLTYWRDQSKAQAENLNIKANEYFQEADFMMSQIQRRQASISGPTTPEGNLPGTNGPQAQLGQGFDFPVFGYPQNHGIPGQMRNGRGRSSSMLSGYSGFTEDQDVAGMNGSGSRKKSDGSSVSAGSFGDRMSPRPAIKTMSPGPIRPPSADSRRFHASMSPIGNNR